MVSFIIDAYDPWDAVARILRLIKREIDEPYEVILAASLLLDTPLDACEAEARALFGDSLIFLATDSAGAFEARLEAQASARGGIVCYLSPAILPAPGALGALLEACDRSFASAALSLLFPGGETERILAAGYAAAEDGEPIPLYVAQKPDSAMAPFCGAIPVPFCFCSRGPFYSEADAGRNFWQAHLDACARENRGGKQLLSAACRLAPEILPSYSARVRAARFGGKPNLKSLTEKYEIETRLTAYGDYRAGGQFLDSAHETQEDIFWGLLSDPNPERVAKASQMELNEPLAWIAREVLYKAASTTWQKADELARARLTGAPACWQTYGEWRGLYERCADLWYAMPGPRLRDLLAGGKRAIANSAQAIGRGLFPGRHA